ncbi:haloacid dehalogenase-like hydrolase [Longispora sp. K20-0274]|uniref:HAD family hydrolase n=1 Tax=Longispora sp. K20-0274 TaxID=3088255 RepID=UPI0039997A6F
MSDRGLDRGQLPLLVLWDVDHTLIENGGVSKEAYSYAFELLVGRPPEIAPATDGRVDPGIMNDLFVANGVELTPELAEEALRVLPRALEAKVPRLRELGHALPGAREALETLSREAGIVQTVLTGNIRVNGYTKLATFGLHQHLDFSIGGFGDDDPVRSNLVGVARRKASAKLGLTFTEGTTVLIGDTPRDVQAGRVGGAYVIGVATGPATVAELLAEGADVALPDLRDTSAVVDAVRGARAHVAG